MLQTIVRRFALLGCVIMGTGALWSMVPKPGISNQVLLLIPIFLYFVATALTIVAIERPAFDQRLRYPGALLNVIAVAFPIAILARWMNGDLPLQGFAPIIPLVAFSALAAALIWVLEVKKVFRPTRRLAIAVGVVTYLTIVIATLEPDPGALDYASYLRALDRLATAAGFMYVVAAVLWLYFLYRGVKQSPQLLPAESSEQKPTTEEQQRPASHSESDDARPPGGLTLEECRYCGTRVLFTKDVCPHCRKPR